MSADEPVNRKRSITPPGLPPGPLKDLKDALFGLYRSADSPSMERIRDRILELADGEEASDPTATPSVDTVHKILTATTVPQNVKNVVAVTAALLHPHHVSGVTSVVRGHPRVEEIRRLWERALLHVPPGQPITDTSPADLEVRLTMPPGADDAGPLPDYVPREHDQILRDLAAAALRPDDPRSGIAVLVSDSTSGKTRALFELLHSPVSTRRGSGARQRPDSLAAAGWRVWPPRSPYSPDLFLAELPTVPAHTVVWLNEAQRYLIDPEARTARDIAAGLRALLSDPVRTPVLVLGTLWPTYRDRITRAPGGRDPFADARALLTGHTVQVPDAFTGADLAAARGSRDTRVRDAVAAADAAAGRAGRATRVSLTQHMAGAPTLRDLYDHASTTEAAVLAAAADARRCGHREWLPVVLLHHAAVGYLDNAQQQRHLADPHWFARTIDTLTAARDVAAARALHRPLAIPGASASDVVRLEDYLEQYGRADRKEQLPPTTFWTAVAVHAHPDDLLALGRSAESHGLTRHATQLYKNAAARGDILAATELMSLLDRVRPTDHRPVQWVIEHVDVDAADLEPVAWLLDALHTVGAAEQFRVLADRGVTSAARSEDFRGMAKLLRVLHETGAISHFRTLAEHVCTRVPLDIPEAVALLLGALLAVGADQEVADVVARISVGRLALDDVGAAGSLLAGLHEAGADRQVADVVAHIPVEHVGLNQVIAATRLLKELHAVGAVSEVTVLVDRLVESAALDKPLQVALLLRALHSVGAHTQVAALGARAVDHAVLNEPGAARSLLMGLRSAGADERVADMAQRLVEHVDLTNIATVTTVLEALQRVGAVAQVAELVARIPFDQVVLDDPGGAASLLLVLNEVGAAAQVNELMARIPVEEVALDDPDALAGLLQVLHDADAGTQVTQLTDRAARHPTELVVGHHPDAVARLLATLHTVDAATPISVLADCAAEHARLDDPEPVQALLEALHEVGAARQRAALIERLPAAGLFLQFSDLSDHKVRFRFGRELDGSASPVWSWADLM